MQGGLGVESPGEAQKDSPLSGTKVDRGGQNFFWVGPDPSEEGFPFCLGSPDIEPGQVEQAVDRVDRTLEQGIVQGEWQGSDPALGNEFVRIGMNLKEFGRIEGYENRLTGKPGHLRVMQPKNGRRRSAFLMWDPGKRRADQPALVRIPVRMSVKRALLNKGHGSRRDEMPLLIGRDDLVGNGIIAQVGLAEALGQTGDFPAIRGYAQDGA